MITGMVGAAAMLLAAAAFSVFSWRTLRARTSTGAFARKYGIERFGLALWIGLSIAVPGTQPQSTLGHYLLRVAVCLILFLPIGLWAGYWWGRAMGKILGGDDSRR
jgi:hypothetical protein